MLVIADAGFLLIAVDGLSSYSRSFMLLQRPSQAAGRAFRHQCGRAALPCEARDPRLRVAWERGRDAVAGTGAKRCGKAGLQANLPFR